MSTATLIRRVREGAHLTQAALAARAGTSQPAIARYESGVSSPSVATLERLLAAAGASLELRTRSVSRALDARTPRMAKLRRHRAQVLAAARRHGATSVQVFGSVVRGEDGPDSDVDLLVDIDVYTVGLVPLLELRDELEALLGERIDAVARVALTDEVARSAQAEAVTL